MKTKHVLLLLFAILFLVGWQAPLAAQDIPTNYTQNPNMEHDLNAIFWYGSWDPIYGTNSIVSRSSEYVSEDFAHSGNQSMKIVPGAYIWVSYPVRGHEEKKFKASFWYKGRFTDYWNFIYRDVGMTFEDLHPSLAEFVGADSAFWGGAGQDALQFRFGGDDGYTEDWTYFEFVWDYPGTIAGWGNTAMWFAEYDSAYLDDFYYGEWYDGQYSGEEPFGFINSDFEFDELNTEWLLNLPPWDDFATGDFLSDVENHTEAGMQSLRLMDYMTVSDESDTSANDRNMTYYLPALGAEGKDMELSFWYMGNMATVDLRFYSNYGVTPEEFPLPAGATLVEDEANAEYEVITVLKFEDESTIPVDLIALQNFDNAGNLKMPGTSWLWSGSDFYTWDDWTTGVQDTVAHSGTSSFWLPGDPEWTGAEGTFDGIEDNNTYVCSFWYKGKSQFDLYIGSSLKYDLVVDPDGIVPEGATADADKINWMLDAEDWTQFVYAFDLASWLADSGITEPVNLKYQIVGTSDALDVGYVDDIFFGMTGGDKPDGSMFTVEPDTLSVTLPPYAARWELPAVNEWTEWKLKWTNPSTDIGGTLTLFLDNSMSESPDFITPEKPELDPSHADWTFFDDFYYGIAEPVGVNRDLVQYDLHTYPNPASDILYLSIMKTLERVEVFNSMGQLVISKDNPDRTLNVSGLKTGIYFLNVQDEDGVMHKAKFLKR